MQGRTEILKVHAKESRHGAADSRRDSMSLHDSVRTPAKDKNLAPGVDLSAIARQTPGMSGADLANLLNEGTCHDHCARFISSSCVGPVRCHPGSQIKQSRALPASPSRSEHPSSVNCQRRLTLTISSMLWNASPLASRKRQRCPVHHKCTSQCWTQGCCHVRAEEEVGCLPRSRPCHLGCLDETLAGMGVV